MPSSANDRNMLFGILAQQMDFISRDALIAAMHAWVQEKHKPLGQILLEQNALTADTRALLEALVQKHLALHEDNAEKSLAAVSSASSIKRHLGQISDDDVQASLAALTVEHKNGKNKHNDEPGTITLTSPHGDQRVRFRIVRPHARGGLGQVYVAHDEELHRDVALKEMLGKHAETTESRTRFLLEAEITGGLEHPGIVPVYGLGHYEDGRPFYAMRFIKGDSLKEAIAHYHQGAGSADDKALELRGLLGRFVDVCQAMQYAHARGVLHRDLKPGNIMLGKFGETLVVDWGLAKPMGKTEGDSGEPVLVPASASGTAETYAGSVVGTPAYMSPEQAAGKLDELGPASDVYSLGATLYSLLTGKVPVEDSQADAQKRADLAKILRKVQAGAIVPPRRIKPEIHPALEAICLKAMALAPTERYASPRALADDIERWLADKPTIAWPEPWAVKARRWVGQHRTVVTGAAVFLLVGFVSFTLATILLADANRTIKAESAEKEKQRLLAVAAHQKAEERLDQSVDTLKLFALDTRTYCEDAMVPGESKKKLFDVLLAQLERLAAADEGKELNEDKIRARIFLFETVALIQIELGRSGQARPILAKALQSADQWLAARPGDPAALARRAAVVHLLGVANKNLLNMPVALKHLNEALQMRQALLGNERVERFTPGKTRIDFGDSLDALERWDEAIKVRREAHESVLKRVRAGNAKLDDLHFVLDSLNWTYQKAAIKTESYEKRKEYLDRANETSAELAKLRPAGRVALARWAKNLRLYGETEYRQAELAVQAKKADAAKAHLAAAKTQWTKWAQVTRQLATSPDLLKERQAFAQSLYELGRLETRLGEPKQAEAHFKYCLSVREEVVRDYAGSLYGVQLKIDRLLALARLGMHVEAAAQADQMRVKYADKMTTYGLTRVYALSSAAVEAARRPAPLMPADQALQATYRGKAIECLVQAVMQGYDDWNELRSNDELAPLHSDPRFKAVLDREKRP